MSRPTVLALERIEKSFGGVQALAGACLDARRGEILGLCGENGAGKSTLLKVLSGVHPHGSFRGTITLDGTAHAFSSTADARAAGIGIVHQELMLVGELTVAQNLALGRETTRAGWLDDEGLEARADALLRQFGVRDTLDPRDKLADLGVGLWQIVEIVRALGDGGSVLVLDEPTAALTSQEAARLFTWLRDLAARGTTCIYVSHRMDEVFAICDRVTVLRDGKTVGTVIVSTSSPAEVVSMMIGHTLEITTRAAAESARPAALSVRGLSLRDARAHTVLDNVDFEVGRGEVVALAGAMGAGRTALLATLFGAARGEVHGEVILDGHPAQPTSPRAAIARGIAFVPEDRKHHGVILSLSVMDNLAVVRNGPARSWTERLGLVDDAFDELEAQKRIAELRIRGTTETRVHELSGGNQQKVAIGKWLAHPPRLLLLDEPTRGVDVGAREEVYGLLDELRQRGTAILFASSDPAEVERLADRVLVLRRGRIIATLARDEATQQRIVELTTGADGPGATAFRPPPPPRPTESCNP